MLHIAWTTFSEPSIMYVAPREQASSKHSELRSIAMIIAACLNFAAITADNPIDPTPAIAVELSGVIFSVLTTAPVPICNSHPKGANSSRGVSAGHWYHRRLAHNDTATEWALAENVGKDFCSIMKWNCTAVVKPTTAKIELEHVFAVHGAVRDAHYTFAAEIIA